MIENDIRAEYVKWTGREPDDMQLLPASGSHRKYYRITQGEETLLGAYNDSLEENEAYFSFAEQFRSRGLNVPETLYIGESRRIYFLEDLGDETLFSALPSPWPENFETSRAFAMYMKVIPQLVRFQTSAPTYDKVFPVAAFDRTSMMWDLNYFKYCFLKICGVEFSESLLEKDFDALCTFLTEKSQQGFMYRDFQSRNIMLCGNEPWFIDFQGGRKGPLGYDLASLLYDAKADLPERLRGRLLEEYIDCAEAAVPGFNPEKFKQNFYACVLMRILQAMGTYGYRGVWERKALFLKSVPYAIRNLTNLLDKGLIPFETPELERVLRKLSVSKWANFEKPGSKNLTVRVYSFSIRGGAAPVAPKHGGGFVFDCRFLPNPGREAQYQSMTGRDAEVIRYLEAYPQVEAFMQNCLQMVKPAIENYIERDFEFLSISFGCTGGQHRSVYCAEKMAALLRQNFDINVEVEHVVHPDLNKTDK